MATSAEELCKGDVVRLVEIFVQLCPSLLINATTLQEAFAKVHTVKPCLRPGNMKHQARVCAFLVKMVLSKWRDLAVYPDRFARAMLQGNVDERRTITQLKRSILPFNVITSLADVSTTTGGTDQSRSSCSTAGSSTPFYYDQGDIDYDGECAALFNSGLPAASRRASVSDLAVDSMWLDEWGIGTDDDELAGPALSRPLRRSWSEELDALVADDPPPKRRKTFDEDDMEAFLAELEADGDNAPNDEDILEADGDTGADVDMLVASSGTSGTDHYGGLAQVHTDSVAQPQQANSRKDSSATHMVRSDRPPPASDGQSVKKARKVNRVLKTTRHCVISRAYKAAKRTALKEGKSKEEAAVLARAALKQAGIDWNANNLLGTECPR